MNTVILTICIATYNRADYITYTLDSIVPQLNQSVEVLIIDGASTDNTEDVLNDYLHSCDRLRYIRLPIKGGVDIDYNKAVELSNGEYCWLFTDDDIVKPGAIQVVLDNLKLGYSLVIVNADVKNLDMSTIIQNKQLDISSDIIYSLNEFEIFFKNCVKYMSFIGCVIIKKSVWINRNKEKYFGTEFIHLGVIFQSQIRSNILVISEPYISIRYGNAQWSSRAFEIWEFKWPKLIWGFDCISDITKKIISPVKPWRKLRRLLYLRAVGQYAYKEYVKYIQPNEASMSRRFLMKFICFIPYSILNLIARIYYSFKRLPNKLIMIDLKVKKNIFFNIDVASTKEANHGILKNRKIKFLRKAI